MNSRDSRHLFLNTPCLLHPLKLLIRGKVMEENGINSENFHASGRVQFCFLKCMLLYVIYRLCFFTITKESIFEDVVFSSCQDNGGILCQSYVYDLRTFASLRHVPRLSHLQCLSRWPCSQIQRPMPCCHYIDKDMWTQFTLLSAKQFPGATWVGFSSPNLEKD